VSTLSDFVLLPLTGSVLLSLLKSLESVIEADFGRAVTREELSSGMLALPHVRDKRHRQTTSPKVDAWTLI